MSEADLDLCLCCGGDLGSNPVRSFSAFGSQHHCLCGPCFNRASKGGEWSEVAAVCRLRLTRVEGHA
jgi:hypothetical protein